VHTTRLTGGYDCFAGATIGRPIIFYGRAMHAPAKKAVQSAKTLPSYLLLVKIMV